MVDRTVMTRMYVAKLRAELVGVRARPDLRPDPCHATMVGVGELLTTVAPVDVAGAWWPDPDAGIQRVIGG